MNAVEEVLGPPLAAGLTDRPALLCGGGAVSYGALAARVAGAGHVLRGLGIEPENRVLLVLRDSPSFVAAFLGAIAIGAVPVAVSTRATAEELAFYMDDSRAHVVLADPDLLALASAAADRQPDERRPALLRVADPLDPGVLRGSAPWPEGIPDFGALAERVPQILPPCDLSPDDMAFWIYTSGTTGQPKAAVHTHSSVIGADLYMREVLGCGPADRVFCASKLFFAYAIAHILIGSLRCGAAAVLLPEWPAADAVSAVIRQHRPSVVFCVPTIFRSLLRAGLARAPEFAAVRHYVSAGESLPPGLHDDWRVATGRPVLEGLGASETLFLGLASRPDAFRPGSCGRPAPGAEAALIDDHGAPIEAAEVPGSLMLRLPSVADRYWNRQEATRRAFRGGWFATGDVALRDADGFYWHRGRLDDMLKIAGHWVSPAEIEDAALEHAQVREAAAVGEKDGEGFVRIALFVVPDGTALTAPGLAAEAAQAAASAALAEDLRGFLVGRLPGFKCPRLIQVIGEMPRTATGKLKRHALRALLASAEAAG